jgi:hypothetical protein
LSGKSRPNLKSCSTKEEEEESVAVSLSASKQPCPKNNPKINTATALDSQALCMYQRYGEVHERGTTDL